MISVSEILEDIQREDMPNQSMRQIWDDFGKEVAVKLLRDYGGLPITPPKRGFLRYANRKIKDEFNGSNMRELVRKYDVSVSHIYSIARVNEEGEEK